jgi:endonuclease/exonuclease/phosphatase family metal-dependent hydrolase
MPITTVPTFGPMPSDVAQELAILSDVLDGAVPSKQLDRNLLVASWNIRELGRSNGKWTTGTGDSPKRNIADIHLIAEILSRFDVVAVQEVGDSLQALRQIMLCLGPEWGFHVTDVTAGQAGDHERLTYLYDLRRVRPSGLAGELVLSPEDLGLPTPAHGDDDDEPQPPPDPLVTGLDRQLVKTPYIMSFTTAGRPFVLTTVHVLWGTDDLVPRAREAEALAKMLTRAVKPASAGEADDFRAGLIALGDFNITKADDPIYKALVDNGLQPDVETLDKRRTLADRPGGKPIAYDQIAWFQKGRDGALQFKRLAGDTFPWNDHILVGAPGDTTFRISDHYPLWVEFSVREAA